MCFLSRLEKLEGDTGAGGGAGNQQAESGEYDQEACSFKTGFKGRLQPQVKLGEKDDEHIEIGKTLNTA